MEGYTADERAAVAVSRVAELYRQASQADRRVRRAGADMEAAAVGQPVARSADPWRCVPDADQRPEHWALWALRWVEEVRADAAAIGKASDAAEREAENAAWLLDSGSCSEHSEYMLRNALRQCDDMQGWHGEARQAADDLREMYDGWLSDMHRAYGTGGDDDALMARLEAWKATRQYS